MHDRQQVHNSLLGENISLPSAELSAAGRGGLRPAACGPPALLLSCVLWAPCPALSVAFLVWFSSSSFRVLLTTLHIQHLASMSRCKVSDFICKAVLGDNLVSCPVGASLNIYAPIPSLRFCVNWKFFHASQYTPSLTQGTPLISYLKTLPIHIKNSDSLVAQ